MKDLTLLVWLTQLGLSVVLPPAGFILLSVWLHRSWCWGRWVIWAGIVLGILCGIQGLISSLKTLKRLTDRERKGPQPVCFNEHD